MSVFELMDEEGIVVIGCVLEEIGLLIVLEVMNEEGIEAGKLWSLK